MQLTIGQKVVYPNQGVCLVEEFKQHNIGSLTISGFTLRVLHDHSTIFVPEQNADSVGLRPLISAAQCQRLMDMLAEAFEPYSGDWKARSKEFTEKLRSGDIFKTAEVLKMLTFLSHEKKLSFREQTLLEKSRFLIISELSNADLRRRRVPAENDIIQLVETACARCSAGNLGVMAVAH